MRTNIGKIIMRLEPALKSYPALVWLALVTLLIAISIPGQIASVGTASFAGHAVTALSILPLALAMLLLIGLAWWVGRLGWTEGGPGGCLFVLVIQGILIIAGCVLEIANAGNSLYASAGKILALAALFNLPVALLPGLLFGVLILPAGLLRGRDEARSLAGTTVRLISATFLLGGIALLGCGLTVLF